MDLNPSKNQIDAQEIYEWFPEKVIVSNRNIFDFSIVTTCNDELVIVWSEYFPERDDEVSIYSCCYSNEKCQRPMTIYHSNNITPYIRITAAINCKVHLLLDRSHGASTELLLKTHNEAGWMPETKIIDIKYATFGHNMIASRRREKIYIIFGDYSEWHTFPYILTAIFTGHTAKEFGKLFMIQGNGVLWDRPRRVTNRGRFSTLNPAICLNDEMDTLHIVWEDERLGYRERTIYYDSFDGDNFSGNKRISGKVLGASLPLIACDNRSNIYVVWSTLDRGSGSRLHFRERIGNSWSDVIELAMGVVGDSITTDTLGNVHFVWQDGSQVYYKIKTKSSWTKTVTFVGSRARISVDSKNGIHLVLLRRQEERKCALICNQLKYKEVLT